MEKYDRDHRGKKSPLQAFGTGLGLTLLFAFLMKMTGFTVFIFPLIFAGILPTIEGLKRLRINRRLDRGYHLARELKARRKKEKTISPEKRILQIAQEEKGRITPTIVALKSDLSLEKAEKLLGDMAKKGHATVYVTENGRMVYEFPDLKPREMKTLD